jgi:hypothetical protein
MQPLGIGRGQNLVAFSGTAPNFSREKCRCVPKFSWTPEISRAEISPHPFFWGRAMPQYETKILSRSHIVTLQVAAVYKSDLAAIRAARQLCGEDETVEIWPQNVCVYHGHLKRMHLVWPVTSDQALG